MLPTLDLHWLHRFAVDRQNDTFTLDLSGCRFWAERLVFGAGRHEYRCWLGLIYLGIKFNFEGRLIKTRHFLLLGAALLLWASTPALQPESPESTGRPPALARIDVEPLVRGEVPAMVSTRPTGFVEAVLASYYHPGLSGMPMANGEPYDPERMLAASLDLPIGSWALVCRGDLCCRVLVADIGPFPELGDSRHGSRAIDLGERPARMLGMIDAGVATVTIHPLPLPLSLVVDFAGVTRDRLAPWSQSAGEIAQYRRLPQSLPPDQWGKDSALRD